MKRFIAVCAILLLMTGCAARPDLEIFPDAPESFPAACREAAAVILAEVTEIGEASGAEASITTPVKLRLVECYSKNHDPYDEVTAHLAAGTVDDFTLSCGFTLAEGETYLLLLSDGGIITGGAHVPGFEADADAWEMTCEPLAAAEIYAEYESLGEVEWDAHCWSNKSYRALRHVFHSMEDEFAGSPMVLIAAVESEGSAYLEDGYSLNPERSWNSNWKNIVHIRTPITLKVERVLKGDIGDTLAVTQDRGTVDGFTLRLFHPYLEEGERYLLFLYDEEFVNAFATVELLDDGKFRAFYDGGHYAQFATAEEIIDIYAKIAAEVAEKED